MNVVNRFITTPGSARQRISLRWLLSSLALVLTLVVGCMPVQPAAKTEPITLHLGVADASGRPSEPYVLEFMAQVKALSKGSIIIEPIWDGGTGTFAGFEQGVIQRVLLGKYDLGVAAARTMDSENITVFQALQAPFLITDDALAEAVATSNVATQMLDSLTPLGLVGLTLWPEDLRHPFSVVPDKPVLSPTDFAGMHVRSIPSDVTYQIIHAMNATPMYDDSGYEVAESGLRQGSSLNGKPIATGNVTFFPKFQVLFANGPAFERLNADQRTLLRQAAAAAQKKAIAEHPREVDAATAWCDAGDTIVLASDAQVAAFEQAAQPVFDQLDQDPSTAAYIAAIRALKAQVAPSPGAAACTPTASAAITPTASVAMTLTAGVPMPRIVYVSHPDGENGPSDTNAEIFIMNADGSNQTRLTNNHYWDNEPAASPDGKRIVFTAGPDAPKASQIYAMNVDGSDVIRLTNNKAVDYLPVFSPDGSQIVFFSDRDGNMEIYVMNADGSNQTRLTNNPAVDEYPNWSPDGKKIVFNSTRDGSPWITEINATNGEIYVMNADGSDQFRLTHDGGVDGRPMWSPDGEKILFDTERDGNADIYVMNADGSNQTRLTDNLWPDGMPSWSLDGQHITFTAMRDKNDMEIYMMNADGSNQTRITYNQGDDVWAGWLLPTAGTP